MNDFIGGALTFGYLVVGLFFLRFWRSTSDRLFAIFATSFWLMAVHRVIVVVVKVDDENLPYIYLIRLLSYVLILYAIVDKNRARAPSRGSVPSTG